MVKKNRIEEIYLNSANKLRSSLPKFIIFLGAAFMIWIFGTVLLIPLGQGVFVSNVEASKVINVIVVSSMIVLIFIAFREIKNIAEAAAGFVTYYIGNGKHDTVEMRLGKLERTFRSLAYVIFASLIFLMFRPVFDLVHPAAAGIIVILIAIWAIVSIYTVVMAMSGEVEEAARTFADDMKKRVKKK